MNKHLTGMMIMEKVELSYNEVDAAISLMKEVAEWGRKEGFRVGRNILLSVMCRFFGVSRSGYYGYVGRVDKPEKDAALAEEIR